MIILIRMAIVCVFGFSTFSFSEELNQPNPFTQGTTQGKLDLSEDQRASLRQYTEQSHARLKVALDEAKGKPFQVANQIYVQTIQEVVIESYRLKFVPELLLRYALNQALELTYGIPTADGRGIERQGLLVDRAPSDLLTVILEDSIRLALKYAEDDRKQLNIRKLTSVLPYGKFGYERLVLARKWLGSVYLIGLTPAVEFTVAVLNQLKATHVEEFDRNLETVFFAEEIDDIDSNLPGLATDQNKTAGQKMRLLRKRLRIIGESIEKKLKDNDMLPQGKSTFSTVPAVKYVRNTTSARTVPAAPRPIEQVNTQLRSCRDTSIKVGDQVTYSSGSRFVYRVLERFKNLLVLEGPDGKKIQGQDEKHFVRECSDYKGFRAGQVVMRSSGGVLYQVVRVFTGGVAQLRRFSSEELTEIEKNALVYVPVLNSVSSFVTRVHREFVVARRQGGGFSVGDRAMNKSGGTPVTIRLIFGENVWIRRDGAARPISDRLSSYLRKTE